MTTSEIFRPLFFTLINIIWVGDLGTGKKFFLLKSEADIRRFAVFMHSECAVKNMLSAVK
jgi:hypothetical protein